MLMNYDIRNIFISNINDTCIIIQDVLVYLVLTVSYYSICYKRQRKCTYLMITKSYFFIVVVHQRQFLIFFPTSTIFFIFSFLVAGTAQIICTVTA